MNYKTEKGKKLSEFEIREQIVRILKEKGYLTIGLVTKKIGINFHSSQKLLFELASTTELVETKRFDLGQSFICIWFKKEKND